MEEQGKAAEKAGGAENAAENVAMFSSITPWYDFQNHLCSLGIDYWWRHKLVGAIVPGPNGRVADVAAGTLDVSVQLAKKYPGIQVLASDICAPMLEYGKKHKLGGNLTQYVTAEVADACQLPYADASVDALTIAFGIRNIQPRAKALQEMHRVLANGGQLCVLEFSSVQYAWFAPVYRFYLETVLPKIAGFFTKNTEAYTYLARSILAFPRQEEFLAELKAAGFYFTKATALSFGIATLYIAIK